MNASSASAESNKKRKLDISSSPFSDLLDDDALRAILVRTCAADHDALRNTCTRFLSVLNSSAFRQERSVLGYAEVQEVKLLSPLEQYKEDYDNYEMDDEDQSLHSTDTRYQEEYDDLGRIGEYQNHEFRADHFRVYVDGKRVPMEEFKVHLLPRNLGAFWEMCDMEGALHSLGTTCFTNRGKLRLPSLKAPGTEDRRRPLLYISQFKLPKEFRSSGGTVGPKIIQSLLTDTFKDGWSIAIYIPHNSAQLTEQDKTESYAMCDLLHPFRERPLNDSELRRKKDWKERLEELNLQDIRQFFRAGFRQISEPSVVESQDGPNYYVFRTPSEEQRLLSEQEANQIEIPKPPPAPPEKTQEEKAFLDMVNSKARQRQHMVQTRDAYLRPPCEIPMFQPLFYRLDQMMETPQTALREAQETQRLLEEGQRTIRDAMDAAPNTDAQQHALRTVHETLQQMGFDETILPSITPQAPLTLDSVFGPCIESIRVRIQTVRQVISEVEQTSSETEQMIREKVPQLLAEEDEKLRAFDVQVQQELKEALENSNVEQRILKSNVLHACASTGVAQPYITFLLDLLPQDKRSNAINSLDMSGSTVLMLAASSRGCLRKTFEMCSFLIEQGADKDIASSQHGLTALGAFRERRRSTHVFETTFGSRSDPILRERREAEDVVAQQLESLLMPSLGPSPEDNAILEDDDDDDESSDIDDEFDEDEEEEEGEEEEEDEEEGGEEEEED